MMEDERLAADEYEKQYYGFSSTELHEDFEEQVCDAVKVALKEMDTALKEQQFDEVLRDQKIVEIYTTYIESAKIPLQKFKDEATKIFAIPKNVILDEDKYNIDQYSDQDIIQLKKEVAELEKELMREKVYLAKCKQQKEFIDTTTKPLYEKVNDIIKFLKTLPENMEIDENNKKVLDIHQHYIQYYFNNEGTEPDDSKILNVEQNFVKESEDYFNTSRYTKSQISVPIHLRYQYHPNRDNVFN